MRVQHLDSTGTICHHFTVTENDKSYDVKVYTSSYGKKFINEEITHEGILLEHSGEERAMRERILEYLNKHWETITQ